MIIILLYAGADISTVHSKTVEPGEYLNKHIYALGKMFGYMWEIIIFISQSLLMTKQEDVLLGRDIGAVLYEFIDIAKNEQVEQIP